jgi:hypothetical protein
MAKMRAMLVHKKGGPLQAEERESRSGYGAKTVWISAM